MCLCHVTKRRQTILPAAVKSGDSITEGVRNNLHELQICVFCHSASSDPCRRGACVDSFSVNVIWHVPESQQWVSPDGLTRESVTRRFARCLCTSDSR